jgi:hypothetical protein
MQNSIVALYTRSRAQVNIYLDMILVFDSAMSAVAPYCCLGACFRTCGGLLLFRGGMWYQTGCRTTPFHGGLCVWACWGVLVGAWGHVAEPCGLLDHILAWSLVCGLVEAHLVGARGAMRAAAPHCCMERCLWNSVGLSLGLRGHLVRCSPPNHIIVLGFACELAWACPKACGGTKYGTGCRTTLLYGGLLVIFP